MTIRQKDYVQTPFLILLLGLLYSNTPIEFSKKNFNGDFSNVTVFVKHFKNLFIFIDLQEVKKNKTIIAYILQIKNGMHDSAENFLRKHLNNRISGKIIYPYLNLTDFNILFENFEKSIDKNTLSNYPLYLNENNILPVLYGVISNYISIKSLSYKLKEPVYDNFEDEHEHFDTDVMLQETCLETRVILNLSKFIQKTPTGKIIEKSEYRESQLQLLKLIEERKKEMDFRIKITELEEIFSEKNRKGIPTKQLKKNISQNVSRFNKAYYKINNKNILGKNERGTNYYPILL